MKSIAAIAAGLLAAAVTGAFAGDAARLNPIGYSTDARYFAFEQYGMQDGSGFPYSEIFVIDLDSDSWAEGTPVRVRIDNETAEIPAARADAAGRAAPVLKKLGIDRPAMVLAHNPPTEAAADRRTVAFDMVDVLGAENAAGKAPANAGYRLSLTQFALPSSELCRGMIEGEAQGFALSIAEGSGANPREVHRDAKLPETRGCALGYDIAMVLRPDTYDRETRTVAIVGVYTAGFEGPDLRYVAVPVSAP